VLIARSIIDTLFGSQCPCDIHDVGGASTTKLHLCSRKQYQGYVTVSPHVCWLYPESWLYTTQKRRCPRLRSLAKSWYALAARFAAGVAPSDVWLLRLRWRGWHVGLGLLFLQVPRVEFIKSPNEAPFVKYGPIRVFQKTCMKIYGGFYKWWIPKMLVFLMEKPFRIYYNILDWMILSGYPHGLETSIYENMQAPECHSKFRQLRKVSTTGFSEHSDPSDPTSLIETNKSTTRMEVLFIWTKHVNSLFICMYIYIYTRLFRIYMYICI
jgi:hypothetical protein